MSKIESLEQKKKEKKIIRAKRSEAYFKGAIDAFCAVFEDSEEEIRAEKKKNFKKVK